MRGNQRDEDFRSKQKHEREYKRKTYAKEYRHRLFGIWCFNIGHGGGWLKHGQAILAFRLRKHAQNTAASHYDRPYKEIAKDKRAEVRQLGILER